MATPQTAYVAANILSAALLQYRDASDTQQTPSTATQFPLTCLNDSQPGLVFKWRSIELANIRAGFAVPVTATCVALVNHNFATDSTHLLEYSIDGVGWALAATLTPDRNRYYKLFATQTGGFWRLRTTSWGSQSATPYLGELWLGPVVTLTRTHAWGLRKGSTAITAKTKTTYGQRRGSFKSSWERVEGPMADALQPAELTQMQTLVAAVGYSAQPFLFIYDNTDPTCWIAYLDADEYMPATHSVSQWDGFPFNVSEQPFGVPAA